jgi:NADH pyrophosphatase NudC (nudix superfamily)
MKYCPHCAAPLATSAIDGIERLACGAGCGYVFWNNPVPVVAALVQYRGGVLLARNAAWPPGKFSLITGFLERGESPEEGILREVREELGLDGSIARFIGYYPFHPQNQLILAFDVLAEGEVSLSPELLEYRVIAPERLRAWDFGTGFAVRDWLAARADTGPA